MKHTLRHSAFVLWASLLLTFAWMAPPPVTASESQPTVRPGLLVHVLDQQIAFQLELGRSWLGIRHDRACFYFRAAQSVGQIGNELARMSRASREHASESDPDAQLPEPLETRLAASGNRLVSTVDALCDPRNPLDSHQATTVLDAYFESKRALALTTPLRGGATPVFSYPVRGLLAAAQQQIEQHMMLTRSGTWATDYEPGTPRTTYCHRSLAIARGAFGVLQGLELHDRLARGIHATTGDSQDIAGIRHPIDQGQALISRMCPATE